MKKYKLLKELPGLEAGTIIIDYRKECKTEFKTNEIQKDSLVLLKKIILDGNYNGWLEEIEEPKSIYNLSNGDKFYYIDEYGEIDYKFWNKKVSKEKLEVGNAFLTKEEAEKELEKRKALTKIKKWIWEKKVKLYNKEEIIETDVNGAVILYNKYNKKLGVYVKNELYNYCDIIFTNGYDAKKCLKECKNEWEVLFNLKE